MSIESLKQKARKAEQKEDWQKSLELYNKALTQLERDDQVDIGLYNRVGDLYVRVGKLEQAVENYQKAVELYREAYLPNNAIAVCKKILRNVPDHHSAFLVIGQIRAEQGFLPDARTNFLTYAERMQAQGDLDESFRALVEFCDLAPEDVGVRVTVAEQMLAQGREDDAVEQLRVVHRHHVERDQTKEAHEIEAKIREIDPDADLTAMPTAGYGEVGGAEYGGFGEIQLGGDAFGGDDSEDEAGLAVGDAMEEAAGDDRPDEAAEVEPEIGGFEIQSGEDEAEGSDLPTMDFDDDEAEEEAAELPMMEFDESEAEEEAPELPTMDLGDFESEEGPPEPTADAPEGDAGALPTTGLESEGMEEMGLDDSFVSESDGARAMEEAVEEARSDEPESAPQPEITEAAPTATPPPPTQEAPAPEAPPPPPSEPEAPAEPEQPSMEPPQVEVEPPAQPKRSRDEPAPAQDSGGDDSFIDLGAMILGEGQKQEKSTRFTVAYEEPSGDEEADFAKMLDQFKDKVSENLDTSDVRAHYDLGTAYKEMGLLEEAIVSFQAALRASGGHLPTYEMMGQTFIEMGQPDAAVRSLERALERANTVEDELVGIYYYLGRAYEELENKRSAVDYYDRVFALDINFADVTERLRELR